MSKRTKQGLAAMLGVALLSLAGVSCGQPVSPYLRGQFKATRPLNIAHRGASSIAPENTLEAALRAFEAGADMWELDVHLSRDRVPIVLHDETLRRTTNVAEKFPDDPRARRGYLVRAFDLAELRTLDAGAWFARRIGDRKDIPQADRKWYADGRVKLPTLREALKITKNLGFAVNVEIKNIPSYYKGIEQRTVGLIRELGVTDRVLISSFDHECIVRVKELAPEIAAAPLVGQRMGRPGAYVTQVLRADAYHPSAHVLGDASEAYTTDSIAANLEKADIDDCHRYGVIVNVWTVDDFKPGGLVEQLIAIGADGIISNWPQRLEPLLDKQFGPDPERQGVGRRAAFSDLPALAR